MITDVQLIVWGVICAAIAIGFGILWIIAKKDAENYVEVRDWK